MRIGVRWLLHHGADNRRELLRLQFNGAVDERSVHRRCAAAETDGSARGSPPRPSEPSPFGRCTREIIASGQAKFAI